MLIAGEASGDVLAAELVKELRAGIQRWPTYSDNVQPLRADLAPRFFGAGGPCMAEAGVELAFDMTQHSVIGPLGWLKRIFEFRRMFNQLVRQAIERQPHAIILVDFSTFNHLLAAAIKRHVRSRRGTFNNWEPKIIKYISPQIWASREGRVHSTARDFDLLLSVFPFEKDWYAVRVPKFHVEFVGHPVMERYAQYRVSKKDPETSRAPLVALFPGSRSAELKRHLPIMLDAWKIMKSAMPNLRARMILPTDARVQQARTFQVPPDVELRCGGLAETLAEAVIAISKTGTITMECAYFEVPTVTMYKVSWWEYQVGKLIVKVKFATMPNLLANEAVFPEFIQHAATPEAIAGAALELLRDKPRQQQVRSKLAEIIASLGGPGASRRAAEAILKLIQQPTA
jgi:lipid-A-disaccharide synthase